MSLQMLQPSAGVKLIVNGSVVGFATGLSFSRSVVTKVINQIDSPFAAEIMPTSYMVQGSITGFRVRGSGGLDGYGWMDLSSPTAYFNQKYCVIEVVDIVSGTTMYTIQKVVFDTDSWSMQSKGLVTFSANFKAVFISNELSDES